MKPCQGSLFNIGEQEVEQFTWVNDACLLFYCRGFLLI